MLKHEGKILLQYLQMTNTVNTDIIGSSSLMKEGLPCEDFDLSEEYTFPTNDTDDVQKLVIIPLTLKSVLLIQINHTLQTEDFFQTRFIQAL